MCGKEVSRVMGNIEKESLTNRKENQMGVRPSFTKFMRLL